MTKSVPHTWVRTQTEHLSLDGFENLGLGHIQGPKQSTVRTLATQLVVSPEEVTSSDLNFCRRTPTRPRIRRAGPPPYREPP